MASLSKRAAKAPSCATNRVAGSHWPWLPMNVTGSCAEACLMGGVPGELGDTGVDTTLLAARAVPSCCGAGLHGGEGFAAVAPVAGSAMPMIGWEVEGPPCGAAPALPRVLAWLWVTG